MSSILQKIDHYFTVKIKDFGATPAGVGWNGTKSQYCRFNQISKVITETTSFTLNDLGCGYGEYLTYLQNSSYENFNFTGYDLSSEMIQVAQDKFKLAETAHFQQITSVKDIAPAAFSVASGIFNVTMKESITDWESYIKDTLIELDKKSHKGFAFNILTKYSDQEYMREDLYYADPCYYFDLCKTLFSRQVALLHDYGLYEFTIIVRKS